MKHHNQVPGSRILPAPRKLGPEGEASDLRPSVSAMLERFSAALNNLEEQATKLLDRLGPVVPDRSGGEMAEHLKVMSSTPELDNKSPETSFVTREMLRAIARCDAVASALRTAEEVIAL